MMIDKKNKFPVYRKFINDLQYKQKYKDKWYTTLNVRMKNDQYTAFKNNKRYIPKMATTQNYP